ncbi:MAG: hypothetical protein IJE68_01745 [Clostridia bacterium]|nr:hypothetical protein [Clostridia bacterium]
MENATKALLIAAAVLVAILIISLGIGIFNTASEQAENAGDLTQYEIQTFNDKFKKYEGDSRTGSDVNALLDTVFSHNNAQEDTSTCVEVEVSAVEGHTGVAKSNSITASPAKVSLGARYKVTCEYDTATKLIKKITVAK